MCKYYTKGIKEVSKNKQITAVKYGISRFLQRYLKSEKYKKTRKKNMFLLKYLLQTRRKTFWVQKSAKLCYGLTKLQPRQLAYEYAVSIGK